MWGVMALCGGCDPRVGGELATMFSPGGKMIQGQNESRGKMIWDIGK